MKTLNTLLGFVIFIRDLLSSRAIQVGFVFFLLVVGGSLLYSLRVQRNTDVEFARRKRVVEQFKSKREMSTAQDVSTPVDTEALGKTEAFLETDDTDTPMSEKTDTLPVDDTETIDLADAFLPDSSTAEEAAEDVPASPHGFGAYPEVPEDFPLPVYWTDQPEEVELAMRVMIKAWTEGERFIGGSIVNGKVRLNFPNTVYVRYKEIPTADGSVIMTRSIAGPTDVEVPPPGEDFPPGVRVLDFDKARIDPYEYLDLP